MGGNAGEERPVFGSSDRSRPGLPIRRECREDSRLFPPNRKHREISGHGEKISNEV